MSWKRSSNLRFLPVSFEESFERLALKSDNACWMWQGTRKKSGYGILKRGVKEFLAHRVSWQIHSGEIPKGMMVCHHCDVRACVNPAHLFLGTAIDNNRDRDLKGRRSHCYRGETVVNSKLTTQAVIEIRASRESQERLARRYGVHQSAISKVKNGRAWKHVSSVRSIS